MSDRGLYELSKATGAKPDRRRPLSILQTPSDVHRLTREGRFHHARVRDFRAICALLRRVQREEVEIRLRVNREMRLETAAISELSNEELVLRVRHFQHEDRSALYANFELDGKPYFFVAVVLEHLGRDRIKVQIPGCVYRAERRERVRRDPSEDDLAPRRVRLATQDGALGYAEVVDFSPVGLGVKLERNMASDVASECRIRYVDGPWAGRDRWGTVRYRTEVGQPGWVKLGLAVSQVSRSSKVVPQSRDQIISRSGFARVRYEASLVRAGVRIASRKALSRVTGERPHRGVTPNVVEYKNDKGEHLRAIIDTVGSPRNAFGVIIPPAWGRTKETLAPLAAVLKERFRRANIPAVIVRYDGIRRRGESYNDPECLEPGREQLNYTLSQGVKDIFTTLAFLEDSPEFGVRQTALISFSAAALDGRKAVALDQGRRLKCWVSVVGMPELQNCMRVISGGVDYPVAVESGIELGVEEILGVPINVDKIVGDAIANGFAYLEDARCDMAKVNVPLTWIHGRYDAWMDVDRIREILGCGDARNRQLLEVPTGHQLSTSREALDVFQLIASETTRMLVGVETKTAVPPLEEVRAKQKAERARLPRIHLDLRSFWRDFLLGRDRQVGVDWLGATSAYRELMREQIERLGLEAGVRVADLGAGTGPFPLQLCEECGEEFPATVDEFDFVSEGLRRARRRFEFIRGCAGRLTINYAVANLDGAASWVPVESGTYDAVLASLVIGYVSNPKGLLDESHRLLRPGGRLVLSTLRRDADLSKLYVDAIAELRAGRAREVFGEEAEELVLRSAPQFLNEASRLLEFEERGEFHFWEKRELVKLVRRAGFSNISVTYALGAPPQAILLSAARA